jgi:hypothetical protein
LERDWVAGDLRQEVGRLGGGAGQKLSVGGGGVGADGLRVHDTGLEEAEEELPEGVTTGGTLHDRAGGSPSRRLVAVAADVAGMPT